MIGMHLHKTAGLLWCNTAAIATIKKILWNAYGWLLQHCLSVLPRWQVNLTVQIISQTTKLASAIVGRNPLQPTGDTSSLQAQAVATRARHVCPFFQILEIQSLTMFLESVGIMSSYRPTLWEPLIFKIWGPTGIGPRSSYTIYVRILGKR